MKLQPSKDDLCYQFSYAIKQIFNIKFKAKTHMAAYLGISDSKACGILLSNQVTGMRPRTLATHFIKLGGTITMKTPYGEMVMNNQFEQVAAWLIQGMRQWLKENKLVQFKQALAAGVPPKTLNQTLSYSDAKNRDIFTNALIYAKCGFPIEIFVTHPDIVSDNLFIDDPKKYLFSTAELPKVMRSPSLVPPTTRFTGELQTFHDHLTVKKISDMFRGKVKTSLNEIVRPFL